ncbi:MAG TPA: hypothetical protein VK003_04820, partial [Oceanobacillus sp.]|nr:hypothetical protein [Oceanobacillus sp.]
MHRSRLLLTFLLVLLSIAPLGKAVAVPPDTCNEVIFYSEDHEGSTNWTSPTEYPSSAQYRVQWSLGTGGHYASGTRWFAN